MKLQNILISLSIISLFVLLPARHAVCEDAVSQELINLGLKFLDDPGDFFFNLHMNNTDFSPLPKKSSGALRFNFFPTAFPLTLTGFNLKAKILNEHGNCPQVDVTGMYSDLLGLRLMQNLSSGDNDAGGGESRTTQPVFSDYAFGAVVTRSVSDKARIFGVLKYSSVNMDVSFSTPVVSGAFKMDQIKFRIADIFFMTGMQIETKPEEYVSAQIGYGFKYRKIYSRLMFVHKHLEIGMDIFPEGLLVVQPFMAWHWYF